MTTMPNFEALYKTFTEALPKGLLTLHQDLEKNMRVAFEATVRRMNLVTREEFEIQSAVLTKTRARLEALEVRVAALETAQLPQVESFNQPPPPSA